MHVTRRTRRRVTAADRQRGELRWIERIGRRAYVPFSSVSFPSSFLQSHFLFLSCMCVARVRCVRESEIHTPRAYIPESVYRTRVLTSAFRSFLRPVVHRFFTHRVHPYSASMDPSFVHPLVLRSPWFLALRPYSTPCPPFFLVLSLSTLSPSPFLSPLFSFYSNRYVFSVGFRFCSFIFVREPRVACPAPPGVLPTTYCTMCTQRHVRLILHINWNSSRQL